MSGPDVNLTSCMILLKVPNGRGTDSQARSCSLTPSEVAYGFYLLVPNKYKRGETALVLSRLVASYHCFNLKTTLNYSKVCW